MLKVLLVDTNLAAMPIYDFLIKSGYQVYVCGDNPNDTLALCAPNYLRLNYSDIAKLQEIVDSIGIDYIVPGCNDLSYKVSVQINNSENFLCFDCYEATEVINNKKKFKQFALSIGIPVPREINYSENDISFPIVVKPADAYSGRGITILLQKDKALLSAAISNAINFSTTNSYIIEEYVAGQLYSHSAFISNKNIEMDFIVEEHCTVNRFAVDTSCVVNSFAKEKLQHIRNYVNKVALELNLADGLIHTQFIANDTEMWVIEVTRRCPGDLYSLLIEKSTGFPYAEAYAYPFLNGKSLHFKDGLNKKQIMRITITQPNDGVFQSLHFRIPLKIDSFIPICKAGSMVKGSPYGKIGILFVETQTKAELDKLKQLNLEQKLYSIN